MELPGKYMAKLLYRWNDRKFENEYLQKLEKNWRWWKNDRQIDKNKHLKSIKEKMEEENEKMRNRTFLQRRNLEGGIMSRSQKVDLVSFYFLFYFYLFFIYFLFFLFLEL